MSEAFEILDASARERLTPEELPHGIRPMLATLSHEHFDHPDWIYERKFDGQRLLMFRGRGEVRLRSRNGQDLGATYPEVADAIAGLDAPDLVLDGEVVAFDGNVTSFSRLQQRMQVRDEQRARRSEVDVHVYVFDLLHLAGHSTRMVPLRDRRRLLDATVSFEDPLRSSPYRNEQGTAFLDEACDRGWEGLIAKRAGSPYRSTRSRDWLKFRCTARQEFVVGGYTDPRGRRAGFGALLVGYHEHGTLRYAGKVGTGYDQRTLERLGAELEQRQRSSSPFADEIHERGVHFVAPELVAEVAFTEWTRDGRLRHPRFLGLRDDKPPEEIVREDPEPSATR